MLSAEVHVPVSCFGPLFAFPHYNSVLIFGWKIPTSLTSNLVTFCCNLMLGLARTKHLAATSNSLLFMKWNCSLPNFLIWIIHHFCWDKPRWHPRRVVDAVKWRTFANCFHLSAEQVFRMTKFAKFCGNCAISRRHISCNNNDNTFLGWFQKGSRYLFIKKLLLKYEKIQKNTEKARSF